MDGGNLDDAISKNGKNISYRRRIELARDISKGLIRFHDKNIVHKDLKPDNILLDS
jgi:serine/threonine protein kinase